MTHTSGLPRPAVLQLYPDTGGTARRGAGQASRPGSQPGRKYVYSDLGLISLASLVERVTGGRLDEAVRDRITGPLGMTDTLYNPPAELRPRIAATEYEPYVDRGLVWGEVHDENSWALGGVAGHAGLFSTAPDLALFCQMLLNGGDTRATGSSPRRPCARRWSTTTPRSDASRDSDRGLGFQLNKPC